MDNHKGISLSSNFSKSLRSINTNVLYFLYKISFQNCVLMEGISTKENEELR